ncbi:hypothetical protein BN7_6688 [Wickerhamomyces ciferrii]|uniref:Uncharacterized protein n=1 Tax=Wickerhamomyces ciferrii (strain ATCC 14091 / BCRC 22168 / CBS 111 / JCM 3599 / NBRC 0793 / NRRL Y-1031 F-60-10) TaxID=1206466 RepID=K0L0H4_WICCF|nr:uncharacterized protein BN7_6688 [Wickerhamomyces ciferrii]CCH47079.1 hypothetical protein BN7_6688 [Wickerhamomyces ciferrii]
MFTSPILRSTIALSGQALKTQAPKQIRFTINQSNVKHFMTIIAGRVPRVLQWGTLVGSILFWPHAAAYFVKATGGITTYLPAEPMTAAQEE